MKTTVGGLGPMPAPAWPGAVLAVALLACASAAQAAEVNVYSARSHYGNEPAMQAFTKKTGIRINTFGGSSQEVFERLRAEGDRTTADLLITVDAGNLWNAARHGLLAPVSSPALLAGVPAHLRDPEGRWFGLTVRARTIMYHTGRVKPAELSTYEALGDPRWKGRLCLRTSSNIYNQSLLAVWIKRHGEARVEQVVKGWIANGPVIQQSDTKVLEAIAAGQCDVGVANTYYLGRILAKDPGFPVAPFWADQEDAGTHLNISGAGVTAHARNRENAVTLLEFLSSAGAQNLFADSNFEYPANPRVTPHGLLLHWGAYKGDESNVAAAGEFQAAAIRLADRVGYR
jgi:iron(III) transport system substrate-binding protein